MPESFLSASWRNITSLAIQQAPIKDSANAQSDPNLRWTHMSEGTFSEVPDDMILPCMCSGGILRCLYLAIYSVRQSV